MPILSLCLRCRLSLSFLQHEQPQKFLWRGLSTQPYPKKPQQSCEQERKFFHPSKRSNRSFVPSRARSPTLDVAHPIGPASLEQIPAFFMRNARAWTMHPRVRSRLRDFGLPIQHIRPLLRAFSEAVEGGELHATDDHWEKYGLTRFVQGLRELSADQAENEVDVIYSTIFFTWASDPKQQERIGDVLSRAESSPLLVPPRNPAISSFTTLSHIQRLSEAASRQYPAEEYPHARRIQRRVIMHVGPTNSGKTHHALRALAAAPTGVYAGPLRLLAHEIWERLNLGEIAPLGTNGSLPDSNTAPSPSPASGSIPDYFHDFPSLIRAQQISKRGNLVYSRQCNMITGEEQKIVSESAPLLACTVEMLSTTRLYDVAVVDEIQMINDPDRGAGWTSAVLGLCAREIHLCGEETAVPVIQALLRETGDEVEVRHYERLTPLAVEERSLHGDYGKVRKGDCVVAFSRSGIFGIQRKIEEKTGMRCAVVYGKLPPEVRSEQARLFNDSNSGYDVIIGSDAIGMGLNLKIRRIIFDAVAKWTDGSEIRLSTSQVKQIAGRAGRYGLLEPIPTTDDASTLSPGGTTTTLYQADLPYLRKALAEPVQPLRYARLGVRTETFARLSHVLPQGASTYTIYEAHIYIGRLGASYRYAMPNASVLKGICQLVDEDGGEVVPRKQAKRRQDPEKMSDVLDHLGLSGVAGSLTIEDRMLLCLAPVPWRDPRCLLIMKRLVRMYRERLQVDLFEAIEGMGFTEALEGIESSTGNANGNDVIEVRSWSDSEALNIGKINQTTLSLLETFHKVLALYIWMSYRNPASWGDREIVSAIKERVERALERCLEGLSNRKEVSKKDGEGLRVRKGMSWRQTPDRKSGNRRRNPPFGMKSDQYITHT